MSGGGAAGDGRSRGGLDPEGLEAVLDALRRRGLPEAEVFAKRGRSRVVERTAPAGSAGAGVSSSTAVHREEGWAVRAGDDRRSLWAAGTGRPSPDGPGGGWPEADGEALALPGPSGPGRRGRGSEPGASGWSEPAALDAPLLGEREVGRLLDRLEESLRGELPEARLVRAVLADGASEAAIASSRGIDARLRNRAAHLRVEAVLAPRGGPAVTAAVEAVVRAAREVDPRAVGRRLADRLAVAAAGRPPERDRGPVLLAPPVAVRLLECLLPLLVGPRGFELAARLEDRRGRLASDALTVRDDGRLEGGPLAAPVDGEGMATGAVTLIDGGALRQPLLAWHQVGAGGGTAAPSTAERRRATGCVRRPGWRDLPRPGPSHLFVVPDREVAAGSLVADVARGYYLLDVDGPGSFDFEGGRLELPVVGFAVESGVAARPVAGARLVAGMGALLRGVEAVARDLAFLPLGGGMIGSPTLLVTGAEIQPR